MIEHDGELYATASQAAEWLAPAGVTPALIRDWRRRGLVTPVASLAGENVYVWADLCRVERDTRTRRRRPRSLTRTGSAA